MGVLDSFLDFGKNVVSGIPGIGGFLSSGLGALEGANKENELNQLQKDVWARDDSSIQRRVADLRAAGLNPALAAGGGVSSSAAISASGIEQGGSGADEPWQMAQEKKRQESVQAAQLMQQNAEVSHSAAQTALLRKQVESYDQDKADKENNALAALAVRNRIADYARTRADTASGLADAREIVLGDQATLDDIAIRIQKKDGVPLADAQVAAARAMASVKQDTAMESGIAAGTDTAMIKMFQGLGWTPLVVNGIVGLLHNLRRLVEPAVKGSME